MVDPVAGSARVMTCRPSSYPMATARCPSFFPSSFMGTITGTFESMQRLTISKLVRSRSHALSPEIRLM